MIKSAVLLIALAVVIGARQTWCRLRGRPIREAVGTWH